MILWTSAIIFAYDLGSFEVPYLLGNVKVMSLSSKLYSLAVNPDIEAIPTAMSMNLILLGVGLISVGIYSIALKRILRGKKILLLFFSLPLFIPSIALFIGIHKMMIRFSLVNTYLGIIIAHMIISIPYATNISISFFQGISRDMEDVARTLGCTNKNLFVKIMGPLMMPGILLSLSICFLLSFSEYFSVFLIGGGKIITLSMVMFPYISNSDYGNGAAMSLVFMVANLGVFFITDLMIRKKTKGRHYLYE